MIAQVPAARREDARLLVADRATGRLEHRGFCELPGLLGNGNVLVLNESRVVPARLRLRKRPTGGAVNALLVRRLAPGTWEAALRPSSLRPGTELAHADDPGKPVLVLCQRTAGGRWIVRAAGDDPEGMGEVPLPPYIRRDGDGGGLKGMDVERYQTVYARVPGSVAAPTAGLHFSEGLLAELEESGVETVRLVLHIGPGTFARLTNGEVEDHVMEPERYEVEAGTMERLAQARREGRRLVAVGTSTVRVLETLGAARLEAGGRRSGETGLFIFPGFRFSLTGAMLTNFHYPRSAPYVMVCAFAGMELVRRAYEAAKAGRYRFLSYGDSMLVL